MKGGLNRYEAAQAELETADVTIARLNQMETLSAGMPTSGAGAKYVTQMRSWGKSLGFEVDEEKLATAEGMRALTMDFVLALIKQTKGAISEKEMDAFEAASAGLGNTRRGNEMIIKMALSLANRSKSMASAVRAAYGNNSAAGRVALDDARNKSASSFGTLWTPIRDVPAIAAKAGFTQEKWDKMPDLAKYEFIRGG